MEHLGAGFAGSERGVIPLGPIDTPSGVAIGAYSCPIKGCHPFGKATHTAGPSGTVALGSIRLLPSVSGAVSVHLANVRLVDTTGRALNVAAGSQDVSVMVGSADRTVGIPRHTGWTLGSGRVPALVHADLDGDGHVTYPDVSEVGIAWDEARLNGNPCAAPGRADLNRDGCVDVTDVELAASLMQPHSRGPAHEPRHGAAASLSVASAAAGTPFVVTSTGDQADSNPGDGVCSTTLRVHVAGRDHESEPAPRSRHHQLCDPGTGVKRITVGSSLPTINDVTGGTTIDGYTQSGAVPNTAPLLDNAAIRMELYATGFLDVLIVNSAGNMIRGVAILNGRQHVWITGPGAHDNTLAGCFIGTDATGTFVAPFITQRRKVSTSRRGPRSTSWERPTWRAGTSSSGNGNNGFRTWHEMTDHNSFQNNLVGLGPSGAVIRNGGTGWTSTPAPPTASSAATDRSSAMSSRATTERAWRSRTGP